MRAGGTLAALVLALGFAGLSDRPLHAGEADETVSQTAFDAEAGWDEFEQTLRAKYAYIERDDMDVDAQLARSRDLALKARDKSSLRRILHQTSLTFSDPHLIVGPFEDDDYNIVMTSSDLAMSEIEGRAIVADVRRDSAAFRAGIRPGDEILSIDGIPASEAALRPYGPVLDDPTLLQRSYGLTLAANGKRVGTRSLTIRSAEDGKTRSLVLENPRSFARAVNALPPVTLSFVGDEEELAVIRPNNSLGNNHTIAAFDTAIQRVLDEGSEAVILDMRETPSGGNTEVARSIIGHFTQELRPYQVHEIPAFEREFTVPRRFVEYVYPRNPNFAGQVYVLHGRWTGSMGEGIVIGMDAATNAITIGSDMGDLLGGLWNYDLEASGARLDLGGEALFHVDGTAREDYLADYEIPAASTAPDGSDPGIAAVLALRSHGLQP